VRIHFLFPSNPLKASAIEEMFEDQARALAAAGFTVSVCPDSVVQRARPLRDVPPGATVVYRGWMLNAAEYGRLAEAITTAGAAPFTTPATYLAAHHLPNWYPLIKEFTPETRVLPAGADPEADLRALGWDAFFLKDYVKSLKTSRGSIIRNPSDVWGVIREMEQFRGEIEGGLCVRRVEDFDTQSERRYFVLHGRPCASDGGPVPDVVARVAGRIPSRFFSVDVVRRADGVLRIVEVGDGQVSDLVGWSADAFAAMWTAAGNAA